MHGKKDKEPSKEKAYGRRMVWHMDDHTAQHALLVHPHGLVGSERRPPPPGLSSLPFAASPWPKTTAEINSGHGEISHLLLFMQQPSKPDPANLHKSSHSPTPTPQKILGAFDLRFYLEM